MNVCSVIVHARPENSGAVQERLEAFPGVEVHGGRAEGKLIVTVEDAGRETVADTLMAFNGVEGVIGSTLIYHYGGEDLEEEVIRETD